MAKWHIMICETCFESGLNPDNVEELCPICRGYAEYPQKVDGMALLLDWEPGELYRSKRQAVAAIDPFYVLGELLQLARASESGER